MRNPTIKLNPFISLIFALAAIISFTISNAYATPVEKVVICHIPPGNPDNMHTIEVGEPAVAAHLAHGDMLINCHGENEEHEEHEETAGSSSVPAFSHPSGLNRYSMRSIHGL